MESDVKEDTVVGIVVVAVAAFVVVVAAVVVCVVVVAGLEAGAFDAVASVEP